MDTPDFVNIATYIQQMAESQPYKRAVIYPAGKDANGNISYSHLTFLQLQETSDAYARGLRSIGIKRGVRTILMVRPSLDFFALTFALFKIGAVPVLVDPGMGMKQLLYCLKSTNSQAFIGISLAHLLKSVYSRYFRSVQISVVVGKRRIGKSVCLDKIAQFSQEPFPIEKTLPEEIAAILFTSGSTGPAKGAVYRHRAFDAQIRSLRDDFGITPGEIDLPTFPLFALFGPALGMTAVIPDMDPTRPAHIDPAKILQIVADQGPTNMFASPALLLRLVRFGYSKGIKMPSLRRVITAGAPVPYTTLQKLREMLHPEANIYTPYGATESLPVSIIESREIIEDTKDYIIERGICVGKPVKNMKVQIIKISDDPISQWSKDLIAGLGQVGEIVVQGPVVSPEYLFNDIATRFAKIRDNSGNFWHRMGDVGHMDPQGRIWFCGRKGHRVETKEGPLFTIPTEAIFNQHPKVFRSALVGVGEHPKEPVICIELEPGEKKVDQEQLTRELLDLAKDKVPIIKKVLYHKSFPVDVRHNAKIFREKLTLWATKELR